MPHKRNPITSERITGLARVLRGYAQAGVENVALWHERDISHSVPERVILPDATITLDYMQALATRLAKGMVVHTDRMLENLELTYGALFSQRLLLALINNPERPLIRDDATEWRRSWLSAPGIPVRRCASSPSRMTMQGRRLRRRI